MNLPRSLQRSQALVRWFNRRIEGVEFKLSFRSRLVAASLDIALEHHRAIVTLILRRAYGSAFALLRLMFEAYIRGVWMHHCALDRELRQVKRDKLRKSFRTLIAELEQRPPSPFVAGTLSAVQRRVWRAMNSFTHSGYLQLGRRKTGIANEANYTEGEILEVLSDANTMAFWAAVAIANLAGDVTLANRILHKEKRFFRARP